MFYMGNTKTSRQQTKRAMTKNAMIIMPT